MTRRLRRSRLALLALTPLAQAVSASICGPVADAGFRCEWNAQAWVCQGRFVPNFLEPAADSGAEPVSGAAPMVRSLDADRMLLEGGVDIRRGSQSLSAEQVEYNRSSNQVEAHGRVRLEDARTVIYASDAKADLEQRSGSIGPLHYGIKDGRGNGTAQGAQLADDTTTLDRVSFTSCPAEQPSWQLKAQRITLDHEAKLGRAEQVRVQIGQVPVLYLPYLSFPLTDERKSGVLSPTVGLGEDGLDLTVPYYLNLAPDYDATLYPRWITQRGLMLGGEFRYLAPGGGGEIAATWLPDDREADRSRDSFRLQHYSTFAGHYALQANLNYVSDDRYFEDLGDSLSVAATSVLPRTLSLIRREAGWTAGVSVEDYEVVDPTAPNTPDPYRRLPRLFFDGTRQLGPLELRLDSELVYFDRESFCLSGSGSTCTRVDPIEGSRFDATPSIAWPLERAGWFVRPEVGLRHTEYRLDALPARAADGAPMFGLPRSDQPSRTTPIYSLDTGLIFEREGAFGNADWRQTLEPRLYYLNVPYRNQDELPLFDTAELDFSFPQLFRTNRFAGADRQGDANQLTFALSTSIWDSASARERLRVGIGAIRYFESPKVRADGFALTSDEIEQSVWVAEADLELNDDWSVALGGQYDPELERTRLAAIRVQRRFGTRGVFNAGYRYRPGRLEQVDFSTFAPINERWRLIARWNFSLRDDRTLEALAGFEYEACCYTVRLVARHYLRAATLEPKDGLYFEIELGGLGSVGRKTSELLSRAILGFEPQPNPFQ